MTTRRLVEYHIERLKNKNAEVRKSSIEELRLLNDPTALPALEQLFRTDPEEEVRLAAQAAGREIFFNNRGKP